MNLLPATKRAETPLGYLIARLHERSTAREGEERPAAILWTDPGREWSAILSLLRERLPQLLVLGNDEYDREARTGPAIWLRCVVDGALKDVLDPAVRIPILYLPGIGREELRAGEDCPERLKPLVELLHRGVAWHHSNGRDWTAAAFFGSGEGMGLDVAPDRRTAKALREALGELVLTPRSQLRGRLEADDFDKLLVDDLDRNVLHWLGDPGATRARLGEKRWTAFGSRCRDELEFDPKAGAELPAGRKLAEAAGRWSGVWDRYAEAPGAYPGIEPLLQRCQPAGKLLTAQPERWPAENEARETALASALTALPGQPHTKACDAVLRLESQHGIRRTWVWARLGRAPLARALEPLARLAQQARSPIGGATPNDIADAYRERGWQADAASWEALAGLGLVQGKVVAGVVRHLLESWLDASARAFQEATRLHPLPGPGAQPTVTTEEDGCVFFVDGLRYDLGKRLGRLLEGRGFRVRVGSRWAALPTVTSTAKPAVSPAAAAIEGRSLGADFAPLFRENKRTVEARGLRAALQERGYQILGAGEFDAPRSTAARGWLETGVIDKAGHDSQSDLPRKLPEELERVAERIAALFDGGWRSVRVVTDHGWLLLPGGLPKVNLPKHLTASRWARCAALAGSHAGDAAVGPWHWNPAEEFATPPGIACFNKSDAFAHGGVSIQECLTPDILVERARDAAPVTVESLTWVRFRCHVVISGNREGLTADLLLGDSAGASVAVNPKPVDADGAASLVLADDEHEDATLCIAIRDRDGQVLAFTETRAGENS